MIADDIAKALPEMQAQAESMMITPCRIIRPTGVTAHPVTGADIPTSTTVFVGGCKVQTSQPQPRLGESAAAAVTTQSLQVHVPVSSGPYRTNDVVEILDAPDGQVVRTLRIEAPHWKSWQTAQRLPVEEVS